MNKTEALEKQVASNYKDAMEAAVVASAYAEENKMLREENAKLRAFAQEVMNEFDGFEIQQIAKEHGLLKLEIRHEPCGKLCKCDETAEKEEWEFGVRCLRKTSLLLGDKL